MHNRTALACEFLAHWVGGVSLRELGRILSYTPRRLADLLRDEFSRLGRSTVAYDSSAKRHCSVVATSALHGPQRILDVVTTLQAARLWTDPSTQELICPITDTRAFRNDPAPDVFRTLLAACTRRQVVDVTYLARTQQHTVLFSPHTLVVTSHRVHFRGYSMFEQHGRWAWWDLVPSRAIRAEILPSSGYVGDEADAEWHRLITLKFRLHPDLPVSMREAMRQEHELDDDHLTIENVREALAPYISADYLERRYHGYDRAVWDAVIGTHSESS